MTASKFTREEAHSYWRNPDASNAPLTYANGGIGRSLFLLDQIKVCATPKWKILELGCNVGRNLAFLHHGGFQRLTGVDINPAATSLLRETFPELKSADVVVSSIEDYLKNAPDKSFNLIYTMAVLEHIPDDSDWIFGEMARVATTIMTIEDERSESVRHFSRDYGEIFGQLGLTQTAYTETVPGMTRAFRYRCFRRMRSTAA